MKEILDSPYLDNLIPYYKLQGALSGTTQRKDHKDRFYNHNLKYIPQIKFTNPIFN